MASITDLTLGLVSRAIPEFDRQTIGRKTIIKLDDCRRIEFYLDTCGYQGNYEVLIMILVSKTNGELERTGLKFKDIIGAGKMVTEDYRGGYAWRGASAKDIDTVCRQIKDYVAMWR